MNDTDLIAMLNGMAYQIEGEAREVRANNDGPDWATTTLSRHAEKLDGDATVLRAASASIERLRKWIASIAGQHIPSDAEYGIDQEEDWDGGDFEEGFCIIVHEARVILDQQRIDGFLGPHNPGFE